MPVDFAQVSRGKHLARAAAAARGAARAILTAAGWPGPDRFSPLWPPAGTASRRSRPSVPAPAAATRREQLVRMVKATKAKKGSVESVNSKLQLVMKSGKVSMGYKSVLKSLRQGKCTRGAGLCRADARPPARVGLLAKNGAPAERSGSGVLGGGKRGRPRAEIRLRPVATGEAAGPADPAARPPVSTPFRAQPRW